MSGAFLGGSLTGPFNVERCPGHGRAVGAWPLGSGTLAPATPTRRSHAHLEPAGFGRAHRPSDPGPGTGDVPQLRHSRSRPALRRSPFPTHSVSGTCHAQAPEECGKQGRIRTREGGNATSGPPSRHFDSGPRPTVAGMEVPGTGLEPVRPRGAARFKLAVSAFHHPGRPWAPHRAFRAYREASPEQRAHDAMLSYFIEV